MISKKALLLGAGGLFLLWVGQIRRAWGTSAPSVSLPFTDQIIPTMNIDQVNEKLTELAESGDEVTKNSILAFAGALRAADSDRIKPRRNVVENVAITFGPNSRFGPTNSPPDSDVAVWVFNNAPLFDAYPAFRRAAVEHIEQTLYPVGSEN